MLKSNMTGSYTAYNGTSNLSYTTTTTADLPHLSGKNSTQDDHKY